MFQSVLNTIGINKASKDGDETKALKEDPQISLNSTFGLKPIIHICDNSVAGISNKVFKWCMKPFGFTELPINIFKFENKTVIQLETGKGWKIYECGQMANWALKPFPLLQKTIQYVPLSVLQQETKSVIQLESSVFCDCNQRSSRPDILNGLETETVSTSDENDIDSINGETGYETDNSLIVEESSSSSPVTPNRVKQISDLLNDFYQATEEEEEFLRRRDVIRRSYQRPSRPQRSKLEAKRRRSASARGRFSSRLFNPISETDGVVDMLPDTLVDTDDHFEETDSHLEVREALDIDVKTTLKKMSRMNQSIENIKKTFSGKRRKKEKSIKERAKSMIIIF